MSALGFDARLWPRVSELLDVALELPQAAREDWLARLDGDDAETLRPVLRRLLADGSSAEPALPELDNDGTYRRRSKRRCSRRRWHGPATASPIARRSVR